MLKSWFFFHEKGYVSKDNQFTKLHSKGLERNMRHLGVKKR
jgi:hypothetical protein